MDEFARLSDENRALREEIAELRASVEQQKADLVLWLPNRPPADIHFVKHTYERKQDGPLRGTFDVMRSLENPREEDVVSFLFDAYRTLWLPLRVKNLGHIVARNVTLDLWIEGIDRIDFDHPDVPSSVLAVPRASRIFDASRPTYFDRPKRDEKQWHVRGRIPVLSATNLEEMPRVGLAADVKWASRGNGQPFRVQIKYMLSEERGQVAEGKFVIACDPSSEPFVGKLTEIAAHTMRATDAALRASAVPASPGLPP